MTLLPFRSIPFHADVVTPGYTHGSLRRTPSALQAKEKKGRVWTVHNPGYPLYVGNRMGGKKPKALHETPLSKHLDLLLEWDDE